MTDRFHVPPVPSTPLHSQALENRLRTEAERAPRRRRTVRTAGLGLAGAAAVAVALAIWLPSGGGNDARAFVFEDGQSVPFEAFFDPAQLPRLERLFADNGVELTVKSIPVGPRMVGKVVGILARSRSLETHGQVRVEPSISPVIVTVGRVPTDAERTAGEVKYDTPRAICEAVDPKDPPKTIAALRRAGYEVVELRVPDFKGGSRIVEEPPAGTIVLSVSTKDGSTLAFENDRRLVLELVRRDDPNAGPGGEGLFCR